jgi:heme/copper-type cytochrome/quinol oxidase subunit 2
LTAANIALYHKEPGFIILIVFSVSYLFGYLLSHNKRGSIGEKFIYKFFVLMALLSSGITYFIQYLFFSLNSLKTGYLTSLTPDWSLTGRLYYSFKALILYIISDPIITVILPLFFILSFFLRRKTKSRNNLSDHNQLYLFYTCLSFSVICYLGFFLLLGIHAQHYLLPAYPFAIISLTGYLQVFMPMIKKKLKHLYVLVPVVLTALLLVNSLFSSINVAVNLKVSSYNFMRYKDALIQKIDSINLIENNRVNFYLPGKKDIGIDAYRHIYILKFFDVDIDKIKFNYYSANQNWVEYSSASSTGKLIKKGDILLITPNSTISQEEIMANLHDLHLRNIFQTQSAYYFEIPEIRHFLKFIMLKMNSNSLVHQMIFREVDFAIYEIL